MAPNLKQLTKSLMALALTSRLNTPASMIPPTSQGSIHESIRKTTAHCLQDKWPSLTHASSFLVIQHQATSTAPMTAATLPTATAISAMIATTNHQLVSAGPRSKTSSRNKSHAPSIAKIFLLQEAPRSLTPRCSSPKKTLIPQLHTVQAFLKAQLLAGSALRKKPLTTHKNNLN